MSITIPEATGVQGNTKAAIVQALTAGPAVSLATDIKAASTVEASFLFYQVNPTATQNKGTQPAVLATRGQLDKLGNVIFTAPTLVYKYGPQDDDSEPVNAVKAALPDGAEVFLLVRNGLDVKTVVDAVDDQTWVHHIKVGRQNPIESGTDEFAVYQMSQETEYVEEPYLVSVTA